MLYISVNIYNLYNNNVYAHQYALYDMTLP